MRPSGTEPGQRRLYGLQTTGRSYRNLSAPAFDVVSENNVAVPMRDGVALHADLHRPKDNDRHPALVAISPYPRQIQHMGVPVGFIEAGQTDFFVPRGYVHLIANCRGTGGSGGTYGFMAEPEHHDLYDLIEWTAAQPWCNGEVGMVGVSYFAIEQIRAAIMAPPHLKAVFPFSATLDWYREILYHGGIFTGGFARKYLNAIGMASRPGEDFFRASWLRLLNAIIRSGPLHRKIARPKANPVSMLARALRFPYAPRPWDELYAQIAVEHPLFDEFWRSRDMTDQIGQIAIPLYLGADWENVSVHLLTPFLALDRLKPGTPFRIALTPRGVLQWPWETLHVEALAWFDHWLKHRDTGIMEGPPIRYLVEGTEEWRATDTWPPAGVSHADLALGADGQLGGIVSDGARDYLYLPANYERPHNTNPPALPDRLAWDSAAAREPVELVGGCVLHLIAASTANDTDWIVKLQDVAPDGAARDLTLGWLRASHRALDRARSKPHFPYHAHDRVDPLTPGAPTTFEIAILPTAHRFAAGHKLRLVLASEDGNGFAMQGLSHTDLGIAARNRVFARSLLTLPLARGSFG